MSSPTVVMPTKDGSPQPSQAVAAVPLKGGAVALAPLPLGGGKRKKNTKRVPKRILKLFKKGSTNKLKKLMKGGQDAKEVVMGGEGEDTGVVGARRRSRRSSRKTRRHGFLY